MNYRQFIEYSHELISGFKQNIAEILPHIISAIVIILIRHFITRLSSAMISRSLNKLGQLIPAQKSKARLRPPKIVRSSDLIGKIVYWIILFFSFPLQPRWSAYPL